MNNEFLRKKQHLVLVLGMLGMGATLSIAAVLAFPVQPALSDHTSDDVDCNAIPCVNTADIVNGNVRTADLGASAVKSGKIMDGEVKLVDLAADSVDSSKVAPDTLTAEDLAPDSVGADELAGVSKLIFTECSGLNNSAVGPGVTVSFVCSVSGATDGDKVVASQNFANVCFAIMSARILNDDSVTVTLRNVCSFSAIPGATTFSLIVYDT